MKAKTEIDHDDLAWLGIDELSDLLRTRALSPVELVTSQLARIDALDEHLNAFITVTDDDALTAARTAETELAGDGHRGPLHGVPVGIKDAIDVALVRCTFGSQILSDRRAPSDADAVRGLKAAGAVVVGKQNMHEFAYGITSENPHYGDVANPWDLERVTGGSSGGTAAAIAAGITAAGVGTDTGGSVRIPAAMCGVVGLKPTYEMVSREGVLPLAWSLDHVGALGRSVLDCFHLLDGMLDPAEESRAERVRSAVAAGLADTRVGVPRECFFEGLEPAVETEVRRAVSVLEELGAQLVEVSLPNAARAQDAAGPVMSAEAATWHEHWLRERADDYGADVLLRLRQGALTRAVDYLQAQKFRTLLRRDFLRAFEDVDVVVGPTVPIVAPLRGKTFEPHPVLGVPSRAVINRLTVPANLTGYPAITVPCRTEEPMPIGVQIMGPPHGEVAIGAVALAYERTNDQLSRRPLLPA